MIVAKGTLLLLKPFAKFYDIVGLELFRQLIMTPSAPGGFSDEQWGIEKVASLT